MHTIYQQSLPLSDAQLLITGEEARHAAGSKRLREGDPVRVIDGQGNVLTSRVARATRELLLDIESHESIEQPSPNIHVCSATPKGPRFDRMIDSLTQLGVSSWQPLRTEWGVVRPRDNKLDRCERVVIEALKQSGRAWLMRIDREITLEAALAPAEQTQIILADATGKKYHPAENTKDVRLLVGPEGGWSQRELERATSAGVNVCRFGRHTLRIANAAAAATSIIANAHS